jgi:hypothetical protein
MPQFQGTRQQWNAEVAANPTYALISVDSIYGDPSGIFHYIDTIYPSGYSMRNRIYTENVRNA